MQVVTSMQSSNGLPSPTLTNPDMILPFDRSPSDDTSPVAANHGQSRSTATDSDRRARSGSTENQARSKHTKQNLSPFRNGLLAQNEGPAMLRSNSERGHGRIKVENSRLSFRPNGDHASRASPSPTREAHTNGMETLTESPIEENEGHHTYKTPSVLDEDEEDPASHAAMTRRAEEILSNAKKRLTNMEGNLNRARSTLGSRPSSSMSTFTDRDQPYGREKTSRLKHRQVNLTLKEDHQGHSRVFSETSVPSSLQSPTKAHSENPLGSQQSAETSRNWFWNGLGRTSSLANRRNKGLQPLTEDGPAMDRFEREPILEEDGEERSGQSPEQDFESSIDVTPQRSPGLSRSRSTHQMRDLRDQMTDLKGKISNLKQRAREDSLRRRSLQSLRTPSPLNNAAQDYSSVPLAEIQTNPGALGFDATPQEQARPTSNEKLQQAPLEPAPAIEQALPRAEPNKRNSDEDSGVSLPEQRMHHDSIAPAVPVETPLLSQPTNQLHHGEPGITEQDSSDLSAVEPQGHTDQVDAVRELPEPDIVNDDAATEDSEETALFEEPVGERHEDRADAFDYEHFFLHSSMGHYARKRSSTHSSNYSAETERPPTMVRDASIPERDESPGKHIRANSASSVSTMATFATATEGAEDTETDGEEWTPRQTMAGTWLVDPPMIEVNGQAKSQAALGTRHNLDTRQQQSTKRHRREHSVTDDGVSAPAADVPNVMAFLQATSSKEAGRSVELQLSDSDKELAQKVINSLAHVCLDLQEFSQREGKYEARVCRRKLDTARRHLDGEVNGEAF